MDAFDADVLIYAIDSTNRLGDGVAALLRKPTSDDTPGYCGIGSVLLVPETLAKPMRLQRQSEVTQLSSVLARLDLRPFDRFSAELATHLCARYRLKPIDAAHLATAINAGADRFITNNRKDFGRKTIDEIDIVFPDAL